MRTTISSANSTWTEFLLHVGAMLMKNKSALSNIMAVFENHRITVVPQYHNCNNRFLICISTSFVVQLFFCCFCISVVCTCLMEFVLTCPVAVPFQFSCVCLLPVQSQCHKTRWRKQNDEHWSLSAPEQDVASVSCHDRCCLTFFVVLFLLTCKKKGEKAIN